MLRDAVAGTAVEILVLACGVPNIGLGISYSLEKGSYTKLRDGPKGPKTVALIMCRCLGPRSSAGVRLRLRRS